MAIGGWLYFAATRGNFGGTNAAATGVESSSPVRAANAASRFEETAMDTDFD